VLALGQSNPDTIVVGAPKFGFIKDGELPRGFIAETVAGVRSGSFKFIGEILYTHGDKQGDKPTRTGDVYVDPLGAGTTQLLTQIASYNVPLLTHWEAWAWDRDKDHFGKLYGAWPQQRFVLPSLATVRPKKRTRSSRRTRICGASSRGLVDGRYEFQDAAKAAKLGPSMFDDCGMLRPDWRAVLLKYSDRLMYGSDFYVPTAGGNWSRYPVVIRKYREIAGQLPPDVAARISWDNAAALYGAH